MSELINLKGNFHKFQPATSSQLQNKPKSIQSVIAPTQASSNGQKHTNNAMGYRTKNMGQIKIGVKKPNVNENSIQTSLRDSNENSKEDAYEYSPIKISPSLTSGHRLDQGVSEPEFKEDSKVPRYFMTESLNLSNFNQIMSFMDGET